MIPTQNAPAGTVAVLVKADGSKEVLRKSGKTDNGILVTVKGDATIVLENRAKSFRDMNGHWAANPVAFVTSHGLFNGTSADLFSPELPMTRGMLACVLHNLESNPAAGASAAFKDVKQGDYYKTAIDWAAENNIVNGYGNGKFGPNDKITREQLACMLNNFAGNPQAAGTSIDFKDAGKVSDYAKTSVAWAVENNILGGKGDGILDPKGYATRAEVASMLMRFVTYVLN